MKNIYKGIPQTIRLDQAFATGKTLKFTVFGEDGTVLPDSTGADISEITLVYNGTSLKYEKEITIHADTPEQYIRIYFTGDSALLPTYTPEDYKLIPAITSGLKTEIVPIGYFLEYGLAVASKFDPYLSDGLSAYTANNTEGVRAVLAAAESELENRLSIYFTPRTLTEKQDNYFDRYYIQLWQFQTRYTPVIELVKFELQIGDTVITELPLSFLIFDKLQGLIEFLPVPNSSTGQGLYQYMLSNLSGYSASLLYGAVQRIPCFFNLTYKTGLWNNEILNSNDKDFIRQMITRKAVQKLLPIIDPGMRQGSISEGIDGVSASINYNGERYLNIFKAEEEENIKYLQKKFGRSVEMVIV